MTDEPEASKRRRKSGSETRQKQGWKSFRLTQEDEAQLAANADRAGLTVGSYIRSRVLEKPQTGLNRRPRVDVEAITRLQGQMNKVASNIHQLLKRVNFRDMPETEAEYKDALKDYKQVIAAIMEALGRGRR